LPFPKKTLSLQPKMFANHNKTKMAMTQLTVSIEDASMLDQIKQAISMLRGVVAVTMKRQPKTGMERALEDIEEGRVYEASSVEDLINQCKQ
jgi:hypothetical protein